MHIWHKFIRRGGLLVVLSGPSGVGKDAVLAEFQKVCPEVQRCVTATTRPPRATERDGVDYHFLSLEEFQRRVEEGRFLEHAEVHGYLYGTPREPVEQAMSEGRDIVLKIDVQGGIAVKRSVPDAVMVFVVPPSMAELERRLRSRNTDSAADIQRRLVNAQRELELIGEYDYLIENDSVTSAAEKLRAIVVAEHSRVYK
ncbi:MAG: guanylate kinase [Armatimonadota bacterium]|nr:guanylate kinase [Armatimonadota bacterium]